MLGPTKQSRVKGLSVRNEGIGSWLARRCRRSADKVAVVFQGEEFTYGELLDRADRLANALVARGVKPGDRVAFLGENQPAYIETLFAVGTVGAIFVPLNTRLAVPELNYQLGDSGSSALIFAPSHEAQSLAAVRHSRVRTLIRVGDAKPGLAEGYEDVLAASSPEHLDVPVTRDDPAIIIYTSGTTGSPKGALLSHGNLSWSSINFIVDYDVTSDDVMLLNSPLFHIASLGHGLLPFVLKGGRMIVEAGFDASSVLELIERHRVTQLSGVPTTYQMLAEHPAWETTDLSSVRSLACGGSAVPVRVIEAYAAKGLGFSGGYGMTETAPGATSLSPSRVVIGSSGQSHFFTDVRIRSADDEPCEVGEVGEIQIQGPNVIKEYWGRPEVSRASFADGVWFRSGDMGYFDEEKFIFISDRLKDMIISGGENIYPAEVEKVIIELPGVADVAVIGIADDKWGEVPRAVVQLKAGAHVSEGEILEHMQGRLARYKQPKTVRFIEEFPRTASGKIRKNQLRDNPSVMD